MAFADITEADAQVIARTGVRLRQFLQNVLDGAAGPLRERVYTSAEIDAAIAEFFAAVEDAGLAPVVPGTHTIREGDEVPLYVGSAVPAPGITIARFTGGVFTDVALDGTIGTLKHNQVANLPVNGTARDITPTVVNGSITNLQLPATVAVLASGAVVAAVPVTQGDELTPIGTKAVTLTISGRTITGLNITP